MKIARFTVNGSQPQIGSVEGEDVVSLGWLDVGDDVVAAAVLDPSERAEAADGADRWPLADVTLLAPVPHPPKFLAVGLNYRDHIAEGNRPVPEFPVIFNKQTSCINDPFADVPIPAASPDHVDYEGELGMVIGQRCRSVSRDDAAGVVAGYLVVNDVSVRDWQKKSPTMTLGKSWDGHGPIGPWLVTADEIGDPHGLAMKTWVNGELRQSTTTDQMVFDCWEQIETISTVCTLEPGDIIATGTSSGVAIGFEPPKFLKDGDMVTIEVEKIGAIEHRFVAES